MKKHVHGAAPRGDLKSPCTDPEDWVFCHSKSKSKVKIVKSRTWFQAKKEALLLLGCPVEELELLVNPTGGPIGIFSK